MGSDTTRFVGLANFAGALQTPSFRGALVHSLLFTFISQALVIAGATLLALSLKEAFRGRGFVRFLVLLPWVAPISLGAIGWKWLLDSLYSVVNWMLAAAGLVDPMNPPMWLGEPRLAMLSVILVHTWRTLPFATVILLAGLTSIPRDIPEAAAVDGGGFWRTHFTITLPMIRPIVLVALLFGVVFTFTDMTAVYILTRGGPGRRHAGPAVARVLHGHPRRRPLRGRRDIALPLPAAPDRSDRVASDRAPLGGDVDETEAGAPRCSVSSSRRSRSLSRFPSTGWR